MDILAIDNLLPILPLAAFPLAVLAWSEWQFRVRPWLIPRVEIVRIADDLLETHGPRAAIMAAIEEDRAWRRSQPFAQGVWRRVREELEGRAFRDGG